MNKIRVSKTKFIFITVYVIYLIIFSGWIFTIWNKPINNYERIIFPWVICSLLINLFSFILVKKVSYINISFWFVILSYCFMFGHVFTAVFNMDTSLTWRPGDFFVISDKFHAAIYALFSLNCITFGSVLITNTLNEKSDYYISNRFSLISKSTQMYKIGLFLFSVGFINNLISSIQSIIIVMRTGNYSNLASGLTSGIFDDLGFLIIPGYAYILASKKLSSKKNTMIMILVNIYFIITMVYSGSRRLQLYAIISVTLCYIWMNKRKKISLSKILCLIVCCLIFLDLLYVIRENRTDVTNIAPAFIEQFVHLDFLNNIINETLTETGLSFYSVVAIISTVPSIFPYELGMTFIRSIISVLPIGWIVGDFFDKAASTYVINSYTGLPVGSSLIGDFYWNFGFLGGVIAAFIFGLVVEIISHKLLIKEKNIPLYFSFFYSILIGLRSGLIEIVRPMLMVLIVPWVLTHLKFRK